jgi:hypothetical protein
MKTRYVVHSGFFHTFGKDDAPTWITRENADTDIPRMSAAEREKYESDGLITAIAGAPSVEDAPILRLRESETTIAPASEMAPTPHPVSHSKRKGGA